MDFDLNLFFYRNHVRIFYRIRHESTVLNRLKGIIKDIVSLKPSLKYCYISIVYIPTLSLITDPLCTVLKKDNIHIMLADDHNLARQSFSNYIETNGKNIRITGEASNGAELLLLVKKKKPHIVILDLEMPVMNGHATLKVLKEEYPDVKVIILSSHYNEFYISELIISGANGYLSKSCFGDELFKTIYKVHKQGFYFNRSVSKHVVTALIADRKLQYMISENLLSKREIEVLQEICNEKQAKEIAELLQISENTVEFHKKNIYVKTKTDSIVGLVKYAVRTGITIV